MTELEKLKKERAEDIAIDIVKKLLREWAEEGDYGAIVNFMNRGWRYSCQKGEVK